LGIGDWGLGPIPNPQSPIPNPQSPIPNPQLTFSTQNIFKILIKIIFLLFFINIKKLEKLFKNKKYKDEACFFFNNSFFIVIQY